MVGDSLLVSIFFHNPQSILLLNFVSYYKQSTLRAEMLNLVREILEDFRQEDRLQG